ncbi:zinc finger (C2H2 type) domain-containing protein, putative [Eimeria tenella]|uniref:Zinc finger (C2H2 type) domain-containing protein, putative n=1 Tax=Eimeria tenella TaxID=5802 RepID=U6KY59_EIMTE|nr:zinc finger (C2H2 type) domain-containing protein, putative [Eimeria tenella]CDJ43092.1 zinc finger (C2H2 type) domain-containing protein, putative [Eimeria tenella]|eukprot:XP_013233842.1 zinc finger (C2H2 type) domain-containing protein, putative [Eimeria tenella]
MALKQPVTQVRLTNVAVVRLRLGGERFEVACYKNKVVNWREGKETDLNEVLQVDAVFQNVAKGELARKAELLRYFGTDDKRACILRILEKGDLQVSELERRQQLESLFNDVVTCVVDLTYSAVTGLPLSRSAVSAALKSLGFGVRLQQPAKAQALHAALLLQQHNPNQIRRRLMKLNMQLPLPAPTAASPAAAAAAAASMLHFIVRDCAGIIETQEPKIDLLLLQRQQEEDSAATTESAPAVPSEWRIVFLVPPGVYRELEEKAHDAGGSLTVVTWNCLYDPQQDQHLLQQQRQQQQQHQKMLEQLQQQEEEEKQEKERRGKERQRRREKEEQRRLVRRLRQQQQEEEQQRLDELRESQLMMQERQLQRGRLLRQQLMEQEYIEEEMARYQLSQLRMQEEEEQRQFEKEQQEKRERDLQLYEAQQMRLEDISQRKHDQQKLQQQSDSGFKVELASNARDHDGDGCLSTLDIVAAEDTGSRVGDTSNSSSCESELCCCCCAEWGDDNWKDTCTRAQRKGRGGRKQRQQQQQSQQQPGVYGGFVGVPCSLHASTCVHQRERFSKDIDDAPRRTKQHLRKRQLQQQRKLQEQKLELQKQQVQQQQRGQPEFEDTLTEEGLSWLQRDAQPLPQQQRRSEPAAGACSVNPSETAHLQEQQKTRGGVQCRVCNEALKDAAELRVHCKSSRHAANLRRQVDRLPPLTDTQWAEMELDGHLIGGRLSEVRGF